VRVKMGEYVFLNDDRLVARHRDSELQYFHLGRQSLGGP
jgi:hypothetical protein